MNTKRNLMPWLMLAFGLLVLVLPWPVSVRADFQAGSAAYQRGDYETAYQEWLPLAVKPSGALYGWTSCRKRANNPSRVGKRQ